MNIKIYGVRGTKTTPELSHLGYGGNTTCVVAELDGKHVVFDAGSGFDGASADILRKYKPVTLALTHGHIDHVQGIVTAGIVYSNNKITVYGPKRSLDSARQLYGEDSNLWPACDRRHMRAIHDDSTIEIEPPIEIDLGSARLYAIPGNHPTNGGEASNSIGGVALYKLIGEDAVFGFATDHEFDYMTKDGKIDECSPELRAKLKKQWIDFYRGADLVIADAQYTQEEYERTTYPVVRGWGHANMRQVVDCAGEAGIGELVITHHDPAHDDTFLSREEMGIIAYAKRHPNLRVSLAREGMHKNL